MFPIPRILLPVDFSPRRAARRKRTDSGEHREISCKPKEAIEGIANLNLTRVIPSL